MSYTAVVNLPRQLAASTGANAVTQGAGGLDDAYSVTIYLVSTANAASTGVGLQVQVAQFDVTSTRTPAPATVESTNWYFLSTTIFSTAAGLVTSSGMAITIGINAVSWRSIRIAGLTSATQSEPIAYMTKQILV